MIETMSEKDLLELKSNLESQVSNLNNTIEEIDSALLKKKAAMDDTTVKSNPYYKDRRNIIKVTINNNSSYKYTIARIKLNQVIIGLDYFNSKDLDFLKHYKMCTKLDWDNALDRLNVWLKDSNLKIKEI